MKQKNVRDAGPVENPPGVTRRTLAHNRDLMLCHFTLARGAKIPLHSHAPSQAGMVISGRVRFMGAAEADAFEVGPGDSYIFGPNVPHGADVLEDAVFVEAFSPSRPEYQS